MNDHVTYYFGGASFKSCTALKLSVDSVYHTFLLLHPT